MRSGVVDDEAGSAALRFLVEARFPGCFFLPPPKRPMASRLSTAARGPDGRRRVGRGGLHRFPFGRRALLQAGSVLGGEVSRSRLWLARVRSARYPHEPRGRASPWARGLARADAVAGGGAARPGVLERERPGAAGQAAADAAGQTDAVAGFADALALALAFANTLALAFAFADTLTFADTFAFADTLALALADTLAFADTLALASDNLALAFAAFASAALMKIPCLALGITLALATFAFFAMVQPWQYD